MPDIKTREVVKGTIKTIDKTAVGAEKMKVSYAKTKARTEEAYNAEENTPSEYASTRVKQSLDSGGRFAVDKSRAAKSIYINRVEKSKSATKNREIFSEDFSTKFDRVPTTQGNGINQSEHVTNRTNFAMNRMRSNQRKRYTIRQLTSNQFASRKNRRRVRRAGIIAGHAVRNIIAGTKALFAATIASGWAAIIVIIICVLFGSVLFLFGSDNSGSYLPVSPVVESYSAQIAGYAKDYGIQEYTDLIKAVMMQESAGKGNDPMGSGGKNPDDSISKGVQNLSSLIKTTGCESPLDMANIREILKGYNDGEDDEIYITGVLQYYPYGNFLDEIIFTGDGVFGLPLQGMTQSNITSHFGRRSSPGGIGSTNHKGLDIAFPTGTEVYACESGTVISAGWNGGFGKCVVIDHGKGVQTYYAHLSRINTAKGMKVVRGQNIGEVGSTGNSTGPHLHLGVKVNGSFVDPEKGWIDLK